jgi:hypothetical protein
MGAEGLIELRRAIDELHAQRRVQPHDHAIAARRELDARRARLGPRPARPEEPREPNEPEEPEARHDAAARTLQGGGVSVGVSPSALRARSTQRPSGYAST